MEHLLEVIVPQLTLDTTYRLYSLSSTVRRIVSRRNYWWALIVSDIRLFPKSIGRLSMEELKKYHLRRLNYPIGTRVVTNGWRHLTTVEDHSIVTFSSSDYHIIRNRIIVSNGEHYRLPFPINRSTAIKQIMKDNDDHCYFILLYSGQLYYKTRYHYSLLLDEVLEFSPFEVYHLDNYLIILTMKGEIKFYVMRENSFNWETFPIGEDMWNYINKQGPFVQLMHSYLLGIDGSLHSISISPSMGPYDVHQISGVASTGRETGSGGNSTGRETGSRTLFSVLFYHGTIACGVTVNEDLMMLHQWKKMEIVEGRSVDPHYYYPTERIEGTIIDGIRNQYRVL